MAYWIGKRLVTEEQKGREDKLRKGVFGHLFDVRKVRW